MSALQLLGPAALDDAGLRPLVAAQLGHPTGSVHVRTVDAAVSPYDLEALTTAGRYRVRGVASSPAGEEDFSFFVKVVQSWERSPLFAFVPPELRASALEAVPWQVEPAVYRSDLRTRLPDGLTMPRCYAVVDLDECSAALWLEDVASREADWDADALAHAALLLGRVAGSPSVAERSWLGRPVGHPAVRQYAEGRVTHQLLPVLRDDAVWQHPLVSGTFEPGLRERLVAWGDRLGEVVDALDGVPQATLHGDACTRNLLARPGSDDLVLLDFGFWCRGPVGFDLGQLLLGEVQIGRRPAADLPALEEPCLSAYVRGLALEGHEVAEAEVRRAHALQMVLFSALASPPVEHLGAEPTPALTAEVRERARAATWVLDLADAVA